MKALQRIIIVLILLSPIIAGLLLVSGLGGALPGAPGSFKKIGLVRIEGVLDRSHAIVNQLRSFRTDQSIAGVLVRVDSPGGATAPSQEIFHEILQYQKQKKPLVVSMGNVAASGGYYISCPAQKIFANPGTITGSIGVILSIPLIQELTKKIGIEMRILKAGKFKDIGNIHRSMSTQERVQLQSLIDDTHDQFIDDVSMTRNIPRDSVVKLADGRIFTGRQALAVGLIDTLGGYEDALGYLRQSTGVQRTRVVERKESTSVFREWLVEEFVNIFPQMYPLVAPFCPHYLLTTEF